MSYPPHLNRLPQLPPGIRPPHFAGFPQGVPAGTPMIPVHMGIMTSAPTVLVPTTVSMVQTPPAQRKDLNPVRTKEIQEGGSGGPTTTVFVGNISEKASDMLVRQLLAKCGLVLSWKRVQGASGKLQAFGFCEYKEPESTLRSLRLLHELLLGDKKLLVKVDAKTKAQLEEWKAKKRSANGGAMSEDVLKEEEEEEEEDLDEDTKRRDQIVKGAIEGLIREHGSELNAPSQDGDNQPRKKKREKKEEEDINVMEMEDDKRDLISREISKFRDTHKKLEEEKGKKEQERQEIDKDRRERDKERERERERRDREREKEREKEKERNDNNNKERERDRDRDRIDRERERTKERERGERERGERERGERERVKERTREDSKDRSRSRERSRDEKKHDREEDQEEAYERRKLERKMRDKETAYQERLKNWEIRERKKARDYDKENQREEERRHEMTKEGKRLKEFLEDYDDDRDESKYYRGSALQKRLRDREKETELDDRDRKREKEEHDQIRQRLLAEGHPDPEAELQRMEEEAERRRQPPVKPEPEEEVQQEKPNREREHREREHREREHREREHHRDRRGGGGGGGAADRPPPEHPQSQSDDDVEDGEELDDRDGEDSSDARTHPHLKPTLRPITSAPSVSSGSGGATPNSPGNESPCGIIIPHENSPEAQPTDEHRPKIGLSLKLGAGASPNHQIHTATKRKKLSNVDSVFNKFGEEEADEAPRKRKLVPLDYGEDDKSLGLDGAEVPGGKGGPNTEEKRRHIRSLIEKIPTARPELFNYPLDWTAVDSTLMDRRIRPWINKKIIEYIGEEEATLVDFVCSKVMSHGTPQGILDDVAMVLDEEAEVFIVKMWRLLIYETEAKKIGLGK
ncbi:RNA-binding protein 25-like isoform X2 [Salvelinus fontinalis]|uniref:RNA-binding protein 25-like isoform X2 n=1 Tax=Salvelinus fontinalis TaxID=8038 RepID=UPI00248638E4|nr:RNA-binding protein 25-like isoform X2 [Salvelinus fontinalis]